MGFLCERMEILTLPGVHNGNLVVDNNIAALDGAAFNTGEIRVSLLECHGPVNQVELGWVSRCIHCIFNESSKDVLTSRYSSSSSARQASKEASTTSGRCWLCLVSLPRPERNKGVSGSLHTCSTV